MTEPPIIDVSGLRSDTLADREAVGQALREASRGAGFFYVVGHDLGPQRIRDAFAASRRFFGLEDPPVQPTTRKPSTSGWT